MNSRVPWSRWREERQRQEREAAAAQEREAAEVREQQAIAAKQQQIAQKALLRSTRADAVQAAEAVRAALRKGEGSAQQLRTRNKDRDALLEHLRAVQCSEADAPELARLREAAAALRRRRRPDAGARLRSALDGYDALERRLRALGSEQPQVLAAAQRAQAADVLRLLEAADDADDDAFAMCLAFVQANSDRKPSRHRRHQSDMPAHDWLRDSGPG